MNVFMGTLNLAVFDSVLKGDTTEFQIMRLPCGIMENHSGLMNTL